MPDWDDVFYYACVAFFVAIVLIIAGLAVNAIIHLVCDF